MRTVKSITVSDSEQNPWKNVPAIPEGCLIACVETRVVGDEYEHTYRFEKIDNDVAVDPKLIQTTMLQALITETDAHPSDPSDTSEFRFTQWRKPKQLASDKWLHVCEFVPK